MLSDILSLFQTADIKEYEKDIINAVFGEITVCNAVVFGYIKFVCADGYGCECGRGKQNNIYSRI